MRMKTLAVLAIMADSFPVSALAAGNSPSRSVYRPHAAQVQGVLGSNRQTATTGTATPATGASATGATLPFTGLDLAVLAAAGVILVGVGYSLRRLTHKSPAA